VTAVRTVKNPIVLARKVMEQSGHVLLAGDGAEAFADVAGVERVPNEYFDTPRRLEQLRKKLEQRKKGAVATEPSHGTVGAVALDVHGHLAAATSTGGLTAKRAGRVGDTPLVGAGTYANRFVAVSCTGTGEQFMRYVAGHEVGALYEYRHWPLEKAADEVIFRKLRPGDGGLIAVSRTGEVAMPFSTPGMHRGVADWTGRFEVHSLKDD
jgi:beta-aspartyl-peptidase (threonine type)